MAFLEARLSDRITQGSTGGPVGSRTLTRTVGGKLKQKFNRSVPLQRYDLSYGIKTKADLEEVRAAFYVVLFTPYEGLRFKDWSDFEATRTNSSVVLITGTTYQLYRNYVFGSITLRRKITKPVAGGVIYDAGGSVLSSSIATTTGIATVASGTPATWVGEFDVPVTFADDSLDSIEWHNSAQGPIMNLPSIMVEELPA